MVNLKGKGQKQSRWLLIALTVIAVIGAAGLLVSAGHILFHSEKGLLNQKPGYTELDRAEAIEEVSTKFTEHFFSIDYRAATGLEGTGFMSNRLAQQFAVAANNIRASYQKDEVIIRVDSDIDVAIQEFDEKKATVQVVFWLYEQTAATEPETKLVYFTYRLIYEEDKWRIDGIIVPTEEEIEEFRDQWGKDS